jgi:hypothetical protein
MDAMSCQEQQRRRKKSVFDEALAATIDRTVSFFPRRRGRRIHAGGRRNPGSFSYGFIIILIANEEMFAQADLRCCVEFGAKHQSARGNIRAKSREENTSKKTDNASDLRR